MARGDRRRPEHRVDHDVHRAARGLDEPPAESRRVRRLVLHNPHDLVRPRPRRARLRGRRPAYRDDPSRPERTGGRDRRLPDRPAGAENQDALARLQPRAPGQAHPRRDPGRPDRRRVLVGDRIDQRHDVVGGHGARLGQAAVARSHPGRRREPHPRPGLQRRRLRDPADALDPGHVGQRRLPEVRRPARAEQVQRHDRRDGHRDDGLALGGRARADDRRRRIRLDQGGAHVRSRCRGTEA